MTPTYPFVVKYDGDPEDQQDRHTFQDNSRKRTKTHDGTVGQPREGINDRTKKQQRRNEERQSWPNQSHGRHESRRTEDIEEGICDRGGSNVHDGRVGQFFERIREKNEKRQRGKNKRNSWSGQSHDHEQSSSLQEMDEDITITIQSSTPHDRQGNHCLLGLSLDFEVFLH